MVVDRLSCPLFRRWHEIFLASYSSWLICGVSEVRHCSNSIGATRISALPMSIGTFLLRSYVVPTFQPVLDGREGDASDLFDFEV